jgi:hypothetical protein
MLVPDHYATLGVARDASARDIRAARRRLLGLHHPDVSQQDGEEARRMTISILLAGEVLLDSKARAAYDLELARGEGRPGVSTTRAQADRRAATDRAGMRDLQCPGCGRVNVRTRRHYCIFCGAGIGDTPRPITLQPLRRSRERRDATGVHAGCGCLFGAALGCTLVTQVASSFGAVVLLIAVPAVIFAVLAHRNGDELWDKLLGLFRPSD